MPRPTCSRPLAVACCLAVLGLFLQAGEGLANPISNPYPDVFLGNIPSGGSLSVSGASYQSGTGYVGEGYVVGPKVGNTVTPLNLKAYNGMNFLINSGSDRITVTSSFPIYSISFDYEIFPNGNMANGTGVNPATNPNWPDFTFKADGTVLLRTLASMPGTNGLYSNSPVHPNSLELAPQFIGSSGTILIPGGATKLEFIDWPPTIGINNVNINANAVPEPTSLAALSVMLVAGLGLRRANRAKG